jgi:predicted deacylase
MKNKNIVINNRPIEPGENTEVNLNVYRLPTRTIMEIPVHVYRSLNPGPVVLFIAGMHGDEINGIEIIRKILKSGNLKKLKKGSVLAIPILNIISFLNGTRELPDGRDLNRCFPGTAAGSLGSRIANDVMREILPQIDFGVDFHTGGSKITNYPQIRCWFEGELGFDLAKKFAPPFILNSPLREGTLRKEAYAVKKPIIVYEAGESMRFNRLAIDEGLNGCYRLLKNLGMLQTKTPEQKPMVFKKTKWVRAKISGLFYSDKKYGSKVVKDEVIGRISDTFGEMEIDLHAPYTGYIVGLNNKPVVNEGDALIHIGVAE